MTDSKRQAHNNVVPMILHASGKEELDKKPQEGIANVVQDGLGICAWIS